MSAAVVCSLNAEHVLKSSAAPYMLKLMPNDDDTSFESWLRAAEELEGHLKEEGGDQGDVQASLDAFFKRALELFPTSGRLWKVYAHLTESFIGRDRALTLYKESQDVSSIGLVRLCNKRCSAWSIVRQAFNEYVLLELWMARVQFMYNEGHVFPLLDTLELAISKMGADIRSGVFWRELLALRVGLYNRCERVESKRDPPVTDPFAEAPDIYERNAVGREQPRKRRREQSLAPIKRLFTADQLHLLISATEDLASTLDDFSVASEVGCAGPTMASEVQGLSGLRERLMGEQNLNKVQAVYLAWLEHPTQDLETVISGYEALMNREDAHTLADEGIYSLAAAKKQYTLSRDSFQILDRLYGRLQGSHLTPGCLDAPAVPGSEIPIGPWCALLSYEISNPLRLSTKKLLHRLRAVFELCLSSCGYHPFFWILYCQTLLRHGMLDAGRFCLREVRAEGCDCFTVAYIGAYGMYGIATESLERAIQVFLPDDEVIHLILGDILLSSSSSSARFKGVDVLLRATLREYPAEKALALLDSVEGVTGGLATSTQPALEFQLTRNATLKRLEKDKVKTGRVFTPRVASLHFLKAMRVVQGLPQTHRVFMVLHHAALEMENADVVGVSKRSICLPSQAYLYHSRVLWRIANAPLPACTVLKLGAARFGHIDEQYACHHAALLAEMGCTEGQSSPKKLYIRKNRAVPMRVWRDLFQLETWYGSGSYQRRTSLESFYAQQLSRIDGDERLLRNADAMLAWIGTGAKSHEDGEESDYPFQTELMGSGAVANGALPITLAYNAALTAGASPNDEDVKSMSETLQSRNARQRMYRGGAKLRDILHSLSFNGLKPASLLCSELFLSGTNESNQNLPNCGTASTERDTETEAAFASNPEDSGAEMLPSFSARKNGIRRRGTNFFAEKTCLETLRGQQPNFNEVSAQTQMHMPVPQNRSSKKQGSVDVDVLMGGKLSRHKASERRTMGSRSRLRRVSPIRTTEPSLQFSYLPDSTKMVPFTPLSSSQGIPSAPCAPVSSNYVKGSPPLPASLARFVKLLPRCPPETLSPPVVFTSCAGILSTPRVFWDNHLRSAVEVCATGSSSLAGTVEELMDTLRSTYSKQGIDLEACARVAFRLHLGPPSAVNCATLPNTDEHPRAPVA